MDAAGDAANVQTLEHFNQWLKVHAADIYLPAAEGGHVSLAELERLSAVAAAAWCAVFRGRWVATGWFPSLASVLAQAVEDGKVLRLVPPASENT
jgi:hypothetical protein